MGSCDQVLQSRFFSFQISKALTLTVTLQIMRSQVHIIVYSGIYGFSAKAISCGVLQVTTNENTRVHVV
jgi:hypothetical protein